MANPYTGVVSTFFSRISAGKPVFVYEHGGAQRDFVHVSDVVEANVRATNLELPSGAIINIGAGTETSILGLAHAVGRAADKEPLVSDRGEFRVGDVHSCVADLERARKLLHYYPRTSLENGLREFINWARDQDIPDNYEQTVDELRMFGLFGRTQP